MDKELDCDFVFGDKMDDVKKMDYSLLSHFKKEVKNITIKKPLSFQKGVLSLLRENYTHYIILGQADCISTWFMLFLIRLQRKKIFFWAHGWYGKETKLEIILKKIFFGLANGVFLYGDYAKNLMTEKGFDEKKLHVIYNSLDYDEQKELRNKLNAVDIYKQHFSNDCINIIFVGRLAKVKQLNMLLQALFELNKLGEKYNLTLIGNGEMKDELFALVRKLNIEKNVWFYGATYAETELSELIYNADMCVSPGNVGLTAMHAMAYGCPVITHNNFSMQMPEFEAIKRGKTGDFFEQNNINSLVETIKNWVKQNFDRNEVRYNCYNVIDSKYNPHYQIKVIKSVIDNI